MSSFLSATKLRDHETPKFYMQPSPSKLTIETILVANQHQHW